MEKKCLKCGQVKPLSDFYKHSQMKDGHLNKCKECAKRDVKENREKRIDYYREYDSFRFKNDPRVLERHRRYQATERGRLSVKKSKDKWLRNNEVKRAVHVITGNAIRSGLLIKQPCEKCGSTIKVNAHHDDYMKPLDVRWLCPKHHRDWHLENGEGANAA